MAKVFLDLETYSEADLDSVGYRNYLNHPSTRINCVGYAVDDNPAVVWDPADLFSAPIEPLLDVIKEADVYIWNAAFDFGLWNRFYPDFKLSLDRTYCSMTNALTKGYPASLKKCASAMQLTRGKGEQDSMRALMKPKKTVGGVAVRHLDPGKYAALAEYCQRDVEVAREIECRLGPISKINRADWLVDWHINGTGIPIDLDFVSAAHEAVVKNAKKRNVELRELTEGRVKTASEVKNIIRFLAANGLELESLANAEEYLSEASGATKRVLELRVEGNKSSAAKLVKMAGHAREGRVYDTLLYHGAHTGRWSGKGAQFHNLPRPKDVGDLRSKLLKGHKVADVEESVKASLRAMVRAPKHRAFVVADYSGIESRGLPFLFGDESRLNLFRTFDQGKGFDNYVTAYSNMFNIPLDQVTGEQRQIGKVSELAFGYGGGRGALNVMANAYGQSFTDERAEELKTLWREANPVIVAGWKALEIAFADAVKNPGEVFTAGKLRFKAIRGRLLMQLPSGRHVSYNNPRIIQEPSKFNPKIKVDSLTFETLVGTTNKQWKRDRTYGGKLAENATQAFCRDIMALALRKLVKASFDVILHVHDSVTTEVDEDNPRLDEFLHLFLHKDTPDWLAGFPLAAESEISKVLTK